MIVAQLPWPPSNLRPNAARRRHYMANAKDAAAYKALCSIALRSQGIGKVEAERVAVTLRFCPPRRGRMDRSGTLAAFKAGEDALAEAIGVDDDEFEPITLCRGEPVKGGAVIVEVTEQ